MWDVGNPDTTKDLLHERKGRRGRLRTRGATGEFGLKRRRREKSGVCFVRRMAFCLVGNEGFTYLSKALSKGGKMGDEKDCKRESDTHFY